MMAQRFLTIQISGEAKRVDTCVELLQMELQTTVLFMNAMFFSGEPERSCPVVQILETKTE